MLFAIIKKHSNIDQRIGRKVGVAESLFGIARVEARLGQGDAARKSFQAALLLFRGLGDSERVAAVVTEIAITYAVAGRLKEALPWFQEGLKLYRDVRNERMEATALSNVGSVNLELGRYDEAQTYYVSSLAIVERLKDRAAAAEVTHNLAEISLKTGAYNDALNRYLKVIALKRELGLRRDTAIEKYDPRHRSTSTKADSARRSIRSAKRSRIYRKSAMKPSGWPGRWLGREARLPTLVDSQRHKRATTKL